MRLGRCAKAAVVADVDLGVAEEAAEAVRLMAGAADAAENTSPAASPRVIVTVAARKFHRHAE